MKSKVSKETYEKVYNACEGMCVLCGKKVGLQAHHIVYRSGDKKLIDEASNMVLLCLEHHLEVHKNKHHWQPILLDIAENIYGDLERH